MAQTTLQKAIAVAQKASEEDEAGNYEAAIHSYQDAVKNFLHILKREPQGKDGNQKIRDRCKQYLDRVEELQKYLVDKEVHVLELVNSNSENPSQLGGCAAA